MAQLTLKETIPSPLILRDMLEEMAVNDIQGPAQGDQEEVAERIRDRYLVGILAPRQPEWRVESGGGRVKGLGTKTGGRAGKSRASSGGTPLFGEDEDVNGREE